MNKSIKQPSGEKSPLDDKILVIISVTLIALLALGLAGGVVWVFKDDVEKTGGLIQAILSVVTSIVTGLMGIAVGKGLKAPVRGGGDGD